MSSHQRILVTGAGGFVGRYLMPTLRTAFPSATLIAGAAEPALEFADIVLPLDLADPGSIKNCLTEAQPDAVMHLAAAAIVSQSFADPAGTWKVNVDGTLVLAQTLMQTMPNTQLVYISSAEAYGLTFKRGDPLDEDAPFAPGNPYAASKAAADIALGEMGLRGLKVVRLRPTSHTGPGQSDAFVVPAFARQLAGIEAGQQEPVLRVGALDRWRDFLDVRDVCAAYAAALNCADSLLPGTALNIASGVPKRIGDILDALIARTGLDVKIVTDATRLRPTDVVTVTANSNRARALLGWTPQVEWDSTLDAIMADWRVRVRLPPPHADRGL
jgi:GDP-4-dehydro-6-deoxy-D-mannose reductase